MTICKCELCNEEFAVPAHEYRYATLNVYYEDEDGYPVKDSYDICENCIYEVLETKKESN